ncbi:MAG TPA: translesion error-prone DNA polymerase V autoproteolytic subunit [Candidatus Paraprevotella stercorigallinarum]|jgi:DNA polymerase V|nr:translesion error-prone DNA polymerase V autoproteolytic subunit [Candidatus Paraprevotella stercorigallinarum]
MGIKLTIYGADQSTGLALPYADEGVRAGFPSPAQDYMSENIDLNRELIRHPATTFYARVVGDSMRDAGIDEGDLLIVDKGIEPQENDVVVAFVDGEFTLKRIHIEMDRHEFWLMPANESYHPIRVTEENQFMIWGVVTYNIKRQWHH